MTFEVDELISDDGFWDLIFSETMEIMTIHEIFVNNEIN